MNIPTIYVAGPMRGYPLHNFPAFDAAEVSLRLQGYNVINPAQLDREAGLTEYIPPGDITKDMLRGMMKRDMIAITQCSHIALLREWDKSIGVRPELMLSCTLDLTLLVQQKHDLTKFIVVHKDIILPIFAGSILDSVK